MQERMALVAALLGVALVPTNVLASAPAGVWAKVQQVVYAPDATSPTRVQVHGALMLYDGQSGPDRPYGGYTAPALGYMYYECPAGQEAICRQEWKDLEANIAAAATVCVGFGMTSLPTGSLRQPGTAAALPDAYPIQSGVSPGFSPCQAIAQFLASGQGGAGGAPSTGGAGGSGGTSPGGAGASSGGAGGAGPSTGGKPTSMGEAGESTGAKPASMGGSPTSMGDAGSDSGAEPVSGSPGSGKGGMTSSGKAGSGGDVDPEPTAERAAEIKASGCSIPAATGAASLLGLGAAVGLVGLGLARRQRSRK